MRKWFLFFCLHIAVLFAKEEEFQLIPSTPEQVAALFSDEESLIGGIVSPLSGQVVIRKTDLIAKGAQDVILSRVFVPYALAPPVESGSERERYDNRLNYVLDIRKNYRGWVFLPHLRMEVPGLVTVFIELI